MFLVDGANLLGAFKPEEATSALASVAKGLKDKGYGCRIFLEHRSWKYHACNQGSVAAGEAFKSACEGLGVTIVGREADLAILQTLGAVSGSVALTNDRYSDYGKVFPELVGTSRLRGFSVAEIGKEKLLLIDGLAKAIKVEAYAAEAPSAKIAEKGNEALCEQEAEAPCHARSFTKDVGRGLCGYGSVLLEKGNVLGAIRCLEKVVARHDAEGCAELSNIYACRGDVKRAEKYARLGENLSRRRRGKDRRNRRIKAEIRRVGSCNIYAKCA